MATELNIALGTTWGTDNTADSRRVGPFQASNGAFVFIVRDGETNTTTRKLAAIRSTDGGQSWAAADTANAPDSGAGNGYDGRGCWQVGDTLHIVSRSTTDAIKYHRFDLAAGTWLEHDTTVSTTSATADTSLMAMVAVCSDGDAFVFYETTLTIKGTDYTAVSYRKKPSGGAWGSAVQVAGQANSAYWVHDCIAVGNRVHFFYTDRTETDPAVRDSVFVKTLTSAEVLGSAIQINQGSLQVTAFRGIVFDDAGTNKLRLGWSYNLGGFGTDPPNMRVATSDADVDTTSWTVETPNSELGKYGRIYHLTTGAVPYFTYWISPNQGKIIDKSTGSWSSASAVDTAPSLWAEIVTRTGYDNSVVVGYLATLLESGSFNVYYRDYILIAGTVATVPPLRLHPRDDNTGSGPARLWPPPSSRQALSPRLHPAYW